MKEARSRYPGDWMNMTPSDWMKMGPSDWLDPTRSEQLYRQFSGWWERNYGYWMRPTKPSDWSRPQRDESCCRRCAPDSCDCFCCIGDVDFAVYARVGEQRVIPIIVENERRREKQITVEFSGWTTRGGKVAPVDTVLLEPKTFTLVPCGEQKVALVVNSTTTARAASNRMRAAGGFFPTSTSALSPLRTFAWWDATIGPSDRRGDSATLLRPLQGDWMHVLLAAVTTNRPGISTADPRSGRVGTRNI